MSKMYEQFETDPQREQDGVWLDYEDYRVKIKRAGGANMDFKKALERLSKKYRHSIKHETMSDEQQEKLLRHVYAQTVIIAWETKRDGEWVSGIEQRDSDELLPFTPENVAQTLENLPPLFEDIQEQAKGIALWRSALKDEIAGN